MKIVVIGGSGLIGSKAVSILRRRGHEVLAASPSSGVNTLTGEGLAEAVTGAEVVVDVANSPSFEDKLQGSNLRFSAIRCLATASVPLSADFVHSPQFLSVFGNA